MRNSPGGRRPGRWLCCGAVLALAAGSGCQPTLENDYGRRSGPEPSSVNGTAVWGEMFQQAGHRVSSWQALSPRLGSRADCIVWFPDDFRPPSREVRQWLDDWLAAEEDRTLIYVGRDYDAEPAYWQTILPLAAAAQRSEVQRRLAQAETRVQQQRRWGGTAGGTGSSSPAVDDQRWFDRLDPVGGPPEALRGNAEWLAVFDPGKAEIKLDGRLRPRGGFRTLLARGSDTVIARRRRDGSRLLLVANGSFLLNLPLVNHEHRKLAARLIDEVGAPGKTVVFLESGAGGPPIRTQDRDPGPPSGVEVLTVWPTNWILMQALAVGILACAWRWRIFGLPRPAPQEPPSDFGRHIAALGELLRRSGDREFALARLQQYRQQVETAARDGLPKADAPA